MINDITFDEYEYYSRKNTRFIDDTISEMQNIYDSKTNTKLRHRARLAMLLQLKELQDLIKINIQQNINEK